MNSFDARKSTTAAPCGSSTPHALTKQEIVAMFPSSSTPHIEPRYEVTEAAYSEAALQKENRVLRTKVHILTTKLDRALAQIQQLEAQRAPVVEMVDPYEHPHRVPHLGVK